MCNKYKNKLRLFSGHFWANFLWIYLNVSALRGKLCGVDEKWLSVSRTIIKLSYEYAKKNCFILERMK